MSLIYLFSILFTSNSSIPENVQNDYFELHGKLLDTYTMLPIANAHLYWSVHKTISNENGDFSIWVKEGTRIQISHIGYESSTYLIENGNKEHVIITLTPSSVELEEVIVRTLPNEQSFKQQVITAIPANNLQQELLKNNLNFMRNIHHLAYQYDMNSYDKLLANLSDKGSAVLFSSNPSMGILGLIKKLKKRPGLPTKAKVPNTKPLPLYPYMRKKGTFQKYFD